MSFKTVDYQGITVPGKKFESHVDAKAEIFINGPSGISKSLKRLHIVAEQNK